MFRLYDTRQRAVVDIRPARQGDLRIYACGPRVQSYAHLGDMRTSLLPDLIRRNAQRRGLSVVVCQNIADIGHLEAYRADSAALNMLPPECASLECLGDVIDIHTGGIDPLSHRHEEERAQADAQAGHEVVRHWVEGEHALFDGRTMAESTGNVVLLSELTARGLDPLAARLAFLEHRYREQMNLTWRTLTAADGTVRHWRELVADWADEPSKPMSAEYWSRITSALDDDLDTAAALRVMRELAEDRQIPAGAKFETFASADRVLGLDLVSLVGRPRPVTPA